MTDVPLFTPQGLLQILRQWVEIFDRELFDHKFRRARIIYDPDAFDKPDDRSGAADGTIYVNSRCLYDRLDTTLCDLLINMAWLTYNEESQVRSFLESLGFIYEYDDHCEWTNWFCIGADGWIINFLRQHGVDAHKWTNGWPYP